MCKIKADLKNGSPKAQTHVKPVPTNTAETNSLLLARRIRNGVTLLIALHSKSKGFYRWNYNPQTGVLRFIKRGSILAESDLYRWVLQYTPKSQTSLSFEHDKASYHKMKWILTVSTWTWKETSKSRVDTSLATVSSYLVRLQAAQWSCVHISDPQRIENRSFNSWV